MTSWIRESNLIEGVNDKREDLRGVKSWKWLLTQTLTVKTILLLHKKIMQRHLGKGAGHLRDCNVTVGGRKCPDWQKVPVLLDEWLVLWRSAYTEGSIMYGHVAFEKVHPFVDGNGRVGRMIMNYQRVKAGLPELCILASKRQNYYSWFR